MGFFDDLSKKASLTYKNTAEKTNKIAREMKLKSLINEEKDKIEELYIEIGKKVYEKHIREEDISIKEELNEECLKIDEYAKKIEDMRRELLTLKDLCMCKVCAAQISINAKFCPKCGAVQESNNEEVETIGEQQENGEEVETMDEQQENKNVDEKQVINEENENINE